MKTITVTSADWDLISTAIYAQIDACAGLRRAAANMGVIDAVGAMTARIDQLNAILAKGD